MSQQNFDISGVIRQLQSNSLPDRVDLVRMITREMRDNPEVKLLVAEIGGRGLEQGKAPADIIGSALMYGFVLGISLERQRRKLIN